MMETMLCMHMAMMASMFLRALATALPSRRRRNVYARDVSTLIMSILESVASVLFISRKILPSTTPTFAFARMLSSTMHRCVVSELRSSCTTLVTVLCNWSIWIRWTTVEFRALLGRCLRDARLWADVGASEVRVCTSRSLHRLNSVVTQPVMVHTSSPSSLGASGHWPRKHTCSAPHKVHSCTPVVTEQNVCACPAYPIGSTNWPCCVMYLALRSFTSLSLMRHMLCLNMAPSTGGQWSSELESTPSLAFNALAPLCDQLSVRRGARCRRVVCGDVRYCRFHCLRLVLGQCRVELQLLQHIQGLRSAREVAGDAVFEARL